MDRQGDPRLRYNIKIPAGATPEEIKEFMEKFMAKQKIDQKLDEQIQPWAIDPEETDQDSE